MNIISKVTLLRVDLIIQPHCTHLHIALVSQIFLHVREHCLVPIQIGSTMLRK